MSGKRIQYLDIAKGVGIILVVLCHAKFPGNHFCTMFYLPLFFFVSGIFFDEHSTFIKYGIKKVRQLYVKFILWGGFYLIGRPFFFSLGLYNANVKNNIAFDYLKSSSIYDWGDYLSAFIKILLLEVPEQLMRPLWFIAALFISLIVMKFIQYYITVSNKFLELLLIVGLFVVGYNFALPGFISQGLVALLFCWLGWKCKRNGYLESLMTQTLLRKIVLVMVGISVCYIASLKTDLIMMANKYTTWWSMLISSIFGIIFSLIICDWLSKRKIGDIISYVGQHTIPILALHMLAFKLVNYIIIKEADMCHEYMAAYPIITNTGLWWLLYSIIGLLVPLICNYLYYRIKNKLKAL